MMQKDEMMAYEAIKGLAEVATSIHKVVAQNYQADYSIQEDNLWQVRIYLWRTVERMKNYLNLNEKED